MQFVINMSSNQNDRPKDQEHLWMTDDTIMYLFSYEDYYNRIVKPSTQSPTAVTGDVKSTIPRTDVGDSLSSTSSALQTKQVLRHFSTDKESFDPDNSFNRYLIYAVVIVVSCVIVIALIVAITCCVLHRARYCEYHRKNSVIDHQLLGSQTLGQTTTKDNDYGRPGERNRWSKFSCFEFIWCTWYELYAIFQPQFHVGLYISISTKLFLNQQNSRPVCLTVDVKEIFDDCSISISSPFSAFHVCNDSK